MSCIIGLGIVRQLCLPISNVNASPHCWHSEPNTTLGNLWTSTRVAEVIERTFGVRYNVSHVSRLLHALGFSIQEPDLKAAQRKEEAIAEWVQQKLPAIKKSDSGRAQARLR